MKRLFILFSMLLIVSLAFAQDMTYVSSQSGDTLFVKDHTDFGGHSTLRNLMVSDSMAPAGRVYFLKEAGFYDNQYNPASSKTYKTIIMGPEQNLKKGATKIPPIICGAYAEGINTNAGLNTNVELLVKNVDLELGNTQGNPGGWAFFNFNGTGRILTVDNCIIEHTWWTWVGGPPASTVVKFSNCYIVNLTGHACRRNGGITDFNGSALNQDTLLVENCTHVNTQGMLYKFRPGYTVNRVIFNHNNFIDCSRDIIMSYGNQTNLSITNNIYVNCQLQPFGPSLMTSDAGECDKDGLPMGLVNVRRDSTFDANIVNHGIYVDRNVTYWDPKVTDIVNIVNTRAVNSRTDWVSQMIKMNTRTDSLFNNAAYSNKLRQGNWKTKLPTFVDTDVLFGSQLDTIKAFSMATVDTTYGTTMPYWRQSTNPFEGGNYVYADWPIPIDLSYSDADLLNFGLGQYPVGDLGWFPSQLAAWKAQRAAEMTLIQGRTDGTLDVATAGQEIPQGFQLQQNYPNPFNPSTDINYTLAKAGNVTLKVFNMLGQEVATLVNGYQAANTYTVNFNASGLASGVYFYKLSSGNNEMIKKMVLVK